MKDFAEPFRKRRELIEKMRAEGTLPPAPMRSWEHYPPGTRRLEPSGYGPNATVSMPTSAEMREQETTRRQIRRREKIAGAIKIIVVVLVVVVTGMLILLKG